MRAHPLKGVEPELFAPEELLEARGGALPGGGTGSVMSGATSPVGSEQHAAAAAATGGGGGGVGGSSWFGHWFSGNLRESAHNGAALAQPPHVRLPSQIPLSGVQTEYYQRRPRSC